MLTDLQTLTHSELIERLASVQLTAQSRLEQILELQQRLSNKDRLIAQYKRMIFGQKRERFEGDPDQGRLPFDSDPTVEKIREDSHEQATEVIPIAQSTLDGSPGDSLGSPGHRHQNLRVSSGGRIAD